jgi:hypothetical protein
MKLILLVAVFAFVGGVADSAPAEAAARWQPKPNSTWQWQLSGKINTGYNVDVYDVDAVETPAPTVRKLHGKGSKVVCYISAGSWENWRPDAGKFPNSVKGRNLDGWKGEKWLDIRKINTLRPIMERRMNVCKKKGYTNKSGFKLTYNQQLAYNRMLARIAHKRGLSIALKNDAAQVKKLVKYFDFAVVEECFTYKECGKYSPFVKANKAVFVTEYKKNNVAAKCKSARNMDFSLIFKKMSLNAWRRAC